MKLVLGISALPFLLALAWLAGAPGLFPAEAGGYHHHDKSPTPYATKTHVVKTGTPCSTRSATPSVVSSTPTSTTTDTPTPHTATSTATAFSTDTPTPTTSPTPVVITVVVTATETTGVPATLTPEATPTSFNEIGTAATFQRLRLPDTGSGGCLPQE